MSGTLIAAIAALALGLFGGRYGLLIVVTVIAVLATGELLRMVRARGARPSALVALAGTPALLILAHLKGEMSPRLAPAIIAAVLGLAFTDLLFRRGRTDVVRGVAVTMLPVMTVGLLASFIVTIRNMPEGFRLTLVLAAMVLASEALPAIALAMRTGGGRVPFWTRVIAGEVGVMVVVLITGFTLGDTFSWPVIVVLGLLIGLAAPVGRVAAGMIEADLRAPDTDTGGDPAAEGAPDAGDADAGAEVRAGKRPRAGAAVLVRVDGFLLAAPVFFYVFRVLAR